MMSQQDNVEGMKRTIILQAFAVALLIVAVRHFEVSLFAGEITMKLYVAGISGIFLALGIYAGLKLRRTGRGKERAAGAAADASGSVGEQSRRESGRDVAVALGTAIEPNDVLSAREGEVLAELARGLTNREIAERLFVSENTIKTHVNNIYAKLGVRRRTQAVSRAKEMKILR